VNELLTCVVGFFGIPAAALLLHYLPRTTGTLVFGFITYIAWDAAHRGEPLQSALALAVGLWFVALQFDLHRHFCKLVRTTAER
jgi:hypothetical protein